MVELDPPYQHTAPQPLPPSSIRPPRSLLSTLYFLTVSLLVPGPYFNSPLSTLHFLPFLYSPIGVAILFIGAGILHFVRPAAYAGVVPYMLPHPLAIVYISGLAEMAGGIGVLLPQVRTLAGRGLILLLIAVFPANVQMLVSARSAHAPFWAETLLWIRLPVQALLIAWVWRATVHSDSGDKQQSPGSTPT
jgi:uncharacterized membrane protein